MLCLYCSKGYTFFLIFNIFQCGLKWQNSKTLPVDSKCIFIWRYKLSCTGVLSFQCNEEDERYINDVARQVLLCVWPNDHFIGWKSLVQSGHLAIADKTKSQTLHHCASQPNVPYSLHVVVYMCISFIVHRACECVRVRRGNYLALKSVQALLSTE